MEEGISVISDGAGRCNLRDTSVMNSGYDSRANLYELLGIAHDASFEEIEAAYRRAAQYWHPDRNKSPNASKMMRLVNKARSTLMDPERRAAYDRDNSYDSSTGGSTPEGDASHPERHSSESGSTSSHNGNGRNGGNATENSDTPGSRSPKIGQSNAILVAISAAILIIVVLLIGGFIGSSNGTSNGSTNRSTPTDQVAKWPTLTSQSPTEVARILAPISTSTPATSWTPVPVLSPTCLNHIYPASAPSFDDDVIAYETLPSGVAVFDHQVGDGSALEMDSNMSVHYTGFFDDGCVFDTTYTRGAPATFKLNNLIQGWQFGMADMLEGGKRRIRIPSDLVYGDAGLNISGFVIPGGATLIFEVYVVELL